ncbi:MAG TPA: tetratricopeptide repeat protein, partial [Longimicrobiaceae bacterium]|nr:tetratricopeptide repeat protein [Longimicrobiaceae bacterium]
MLWKFENLFALATLTAGIDRTGLQRLDAVLFPSGIGEFEEEKYRVMSGSRALQRLEPLTPDILGEMFVLDHLDPRKGADSRLAELFRQRAWEINPVGMIAFLARSTMDFPLHPTLNPLTQPVDTDPIVRIGWALAAFFLCTAHGSAGRISEARALYQDLVALSEAHPDEPAVREPRAKAAYNLMYDYIGHGKLEEARALYEGLVALSEAHPDEPAVREQRAMATVNLGVVYGKQGQLEAARALYEGLVALSEAHPDEPAVREPRA